VELGRRSGAQVEILSGVEPGESVAREDLAVARRSGA
jgi:hypothetical protein